MKRSIVILISLFTLIFFFHSLSIAQVFEGDEYILKMEVDPDNSSSSVSYGESSILDFNKETKTIYGDGYTAKLSYEDSIKNLPLVITLSSDTINFGEINPGEPLIRSQSIKVFPGPAKGYQVIISQDENLKLSNKEIPSTSCDSGNCNQILSDFWTLPLVYGFGYRCDDSEGNGCNPVTEKNQYKRFANEKANELPVRVISSAFPVPVSSILSYKLNIPGNQDQGGYQNIIKYIIVPNL